MNLIGTGMEVLHLGYWTQASSLAIGINDFRSISKILKRVEENVMADMSLLLYPEHNKHRKEAPTYCKERKNQNMHESKKNKQEWH